MAFDGDIAEYQERGQARIRRALDEVATLFSSRGEQFTNEDADQLTKEPAPSIPSFPYLMVFAGIIKDMVDVLDFTIVGTIAVFFFSLIFSFILMFWCLGKISGGWWKRGMIRWVLKRLAFCIGIEMFPFVQLIPATTTFILLAHFRETKIAKLFNEGLERLHKAGWKG